MRGNRGLAHGSGRAAGTRWRSPRIVALRGHWLANSARHPPRATRLVRARAASRRGGGGWARQMGPADASGYSDACQDLLTTTSRLAGRRAQRPRGACERVEILHCATKHR